MRAVLRRVEGEVTSAILVGDVMIDLDAKTASRGGTRIALTPMEFDLLVLLARHRGKLVSREQIELAIHAGAEPQVSNVVDVLVLRLRKKLGQQLITTRRIKGTAWGSRSARGSWSSTAAASTTATRRAGAPRSRCGCRGPSHSPELPTVQVAVDQSS